MAVGRIRGPCEPGPFSGNLIIFGVGPGGVSKPSLLKPSGSALGSVSSENESEDMQGKSEEAQRQ